MKRTKKKSGGGGEKVERLVWSVSERGGEREEKDETGEEKWFLFCGVRSLLAWLVGFAPVLWACVKWTKNDIANRLKIDNLIHCELPREI